MTEPSWEDVVHVELVEGVAVITVDHPPVNALAPAVLEGLGRRLDAAAGDDAVRAIVLTGAHGNFVAGADVTRLERIAQGAPLDDPTRPVPRLPDLISSLERSDKPTLAAIDGFALGGGLELALGCHARVGSTRCRLGLPELQLGLIPGAGGTQRLPRVAGVAAASEMMLSSRQVKAEEALGLGILDAVVADVELLPRARALALELGSGSRPIRRTLARSDALEPPDRISSVLAEARATAAKRFPNVGYPLACLDAIAFGIANGAEAGLARERELFLEALSAEAARGLIHVFFAERAAGKVPGVTDLGLAPSPLSTVAVIGGGTMGSGIATALLEAGLSVILAEQSDACAEQARARVQKNIDQKLAKGRLSAEQARETAARLVTQVGFAGFERVGFVIEAASEDLELKRRLFAELGRRVGEQTWLATNTSTIDVGIVAEAAGMPSRVLGLHFFSPAHVMRLVEVIRTEHTAAQAMVDALALVKRMKKTAVTVTSCPGFLVNRVFMPYSQLTGFLIDRGVSPYRIDRALKAFGMPMGPSRMSDLAGVDVGVAAGSILDDAYPARVYRSALRRLLAEAGRLGEKSGAGHYRYRDGKAEEDPELETFVERARELAGAPAPLEGVTDQGIVELLLFGVVNEACRAVEEGVVLRASDVDVAAILGMGFPAYRGGPMKWADGVGAGRVLEALQSWQGHHGLGIFAPSAYLEERAREGRSLL